MDLKDFVKNSLTQIAEGILEASDKKWGQSPISTKWVLSFPDFASLHPGYIDRAVVVG